MTNIKDILAKYGISVPEDKQKDFEKDFNENYKTIVEVNKIVTARDVVCISIKFVFIALSSLIFY